jgi:hypothetical protein
VTFKECDRCGGNTKEREYLTIRSVTLTGAGADGTVKVDLCEDCLKELGVFIGQEKNLFFDFNRWF